MTCPSLLIVSHDHDGAIRHGNVLPVRLGDGFKTVHALLEGHTLARVDKALECGRGIAEVPYLHDPPREVSD